MLIVAIDTSGKQGSVALCRGDESQLEVLATLDIAGGTYSARLVPCIDELLRTAGLDKSQIGGLVVVDGPGSFTGLRVGLSTAKALSEALEKPLATVSMLEALALTYGAPDEVVTAVLDAGRGEVYIGEFEVTGKRAVLHHQSIAKLSEVLARGWPTGARVLTTDARLEGAGIVAALKADRVASIGLRKLLEGDTADAETLDANYIRRSDAELFSSPKR